MLEKMEIYFKEAELIFVTPFKYDNLFKWSPFLVRKTT